jgi:O-methyltransferase involved in polyketide biosynthesis
MTLSKAVAVTPAPKLGLDLGHLAETLLGPLYSRSEAARRGAILEDPLAIALVDSIDYAFRDRLGPPEMVLVLRALTFDEEIRLFLRESPDATVVSLGEGLDTQFWRVDNGRVRWVSIDVPEVSALRRRLLPACDRHRHLAGSALDFAWMDEVDASRGILVTAQGLLMYLEPAEVVRLISGLADRFPGGRFAFDCVPRSFSRETLRGFTRPSGYRVPPMPFGLDPHEVATLQSIHPCIERVQEVVGWRRYSMLLGCPIPRAREHAPIFVRVMFGTRSRACEPRER